MAALTLTIDMIVRRVEDLITHPSLVIVMYTFVQALVILWDVVIRIHLVIHVLVCRSHGWTRLVFRDEVLLEQELLIVDIISFLTHPV